MLGIHDFASIINLTLLSTAQVRENAIKLLASTVRHLWQRNSKKTCLSNSNVKNNE